MSLWGHLAELRSRLLKALLGIAAGCVLAWNLADRLLDCLLRPVLKELPSGQALVFTGLEDAFLLLFKTSLWAGFLLASPWWLWQAWAFVAPALTKREKQAVPRLTALATLLLAGGAAFAYFLAFPLTFRFFLAFSSEVLQPLPAADRYLSLAMGLILAFALAFQLPLLLMFLNRLGLVEAEGLRRRRRYAIVVFFIAGALLTPPDVVSQVALAAVLTGLYELSILLTSRNFFGLNQTLTGKSPGAAGGGS
ncbi:MAG: twin-arginine translocase subunit TatC [Candidatus Adiutrix sp.]|nr:twin-arginine translocase subunit TatC [Candidatus Adiutrix sp.]